MADSIFEPEIRYSLKHLSSMGIDPDYPIAFECKRESGNSLAFNRVNEDQLIALEDFEEKPYFHKMLVASSVGGKSRFMLKSGFDFLYMPKGKSFVLVNFRCTKKAGGKNLPKGTNRCFAMSLRQYKKAIYCHEGIRKSLPFEWFTDSKNATEITRIRITELGLKDKHFYCWDLKKIIREEVIFPG